MEKLEKLKDLEIEFLYRKGFNDYQIARELEISNSTVFRWRKGKGLPAKNTKPTLQNRPIELSQENKEILCGILLGDGSLQYYPNYRWKSPIFKCDHGSAQKAYAESICNKLSNLGTTLKEYHRIDKRTNKEYTTFTVKTRANQALLPLYNELYSSGTKQITKSFLENFTIKSLAYLYMDDGYADQKTAYICTDAFSQESKEILVQHLKDNFNLNFSIVNHGKYYRLRLSQYDFGRFCTLVSPYIIESLKYKLKTVS